MSDGLNPERPGWVPSDLYPFESHFIAVNGVKMHYLDEGSGPVLLLMHGNPTWSFLYRNVILGLRDRFRCIAIDYPGFGLSEVPSGYTFLPSEHSLVAEAVVKELGLTDITMMVQDWGGPIGFGIATRNPELFKAFVIGNTWGWPQGNVRTWTFSKFLGGPIGKSLILNKNFFVEKVMPTGIKTGPLPPAAAQAYRGRFDTPESRVPTWVFPREILGSRNTLLREVEQGLPALADRPVLFTWPTGDIAFKAPELKKWQGLFPKHTTVILQGAGHFIQEDAPDQIVEAIGAWYPTL